MCTQRTCFYSWGGFLVLILVILFLTPAQVYAAAYTVNSTADVAGLAANCSSGTGTCTLRSAIQAANAIGGGGTITLPAGTYTLAIPGVGENAAATGDLDFTGLGGPVTITGAGATTTIIDGGAIDRVFDLISPANVTITGVTIRNGNPGAAAGGGAFNTGGGTTLFVNNSIIMNNTAPAEGGAIAAGANGSAITMNNVAITNNTSPGGGINVGAASTFTLSIGTLSGNSDSAINNSGTVNLTNVSISGNLTVGNGGAIDNKATGIVNLTNVTINSNTAPAVNVGGINNAGTVNLKNTIIANSIGSNCGGAMISLGGNVSTDATCGLSAATGDLPVTLPVNLGLEIDLIDNGGTLPFHQLTLSLLAGSPAIDAGVAAGCPPTDARGFARPVDGNIPLDGVATCDIGAFEFRPQKIAVSPANINFGTITNGTTSDQVLTINNLGDGNLTISGIATAVDPLNLPFSIVAAADTCTGATLPHPPSSCTTTVRFQPTAAAAASDTFNISSNDPLAPIVTFALSGVGSAVPAPNIAITDSLGINNDHLLPFGDVAINDAADATVTISNVGSANVVLGTIASADPLAAPFSITNNTCSGTIAPTASCTLTVHFAPTANAAASDTFDIPVSNVPGTTSITMTVTGSGISAIGNSPPSIPVLVDPANGQTGVPTTMTFVWNKSVDPNGDAVTYRFSNCTDSTFAAADCAPTTVASAPGIWLAGIGSFGAGILLIGFVAKNGTRRARMMMLVIALLLVSVTFFVACHKSSSETPPPAPAEQISNIVRNLTPNTTYYWKVVADDGKGGTSTSAVSSYTTGQ